MTQGLKQRLVGAVVLLAIAVLFVPSFLRERQVEPVSTKTLIPDQPVRETLTFESPRAPDNIEPAPAPESMFVPEENSQPVVESLEQAQTEEASADASPAEPSTPSEPRERDLEQGAWVVQVASFRSADSARNLRDRLQAEGHRAYMRSATTDSGEVSRVYIGPKVDRDEAQSTKAAVDQLLQVESLIMRFEP